MPIVHRSRFIVFHLVDSFSIRVEEERAEKYR